MRISSSLPPTSHTLFVLRAQCAADIMADAPSLPSSSKAETFKENLTAGYDKEHWHEVCQLLHASDVLQ